MRLHGAGLTNGIPEAQNRTESELPDRTRLRISAAGGNIVVMFTLASELGHGNAAREDVAESVLWWTKASEAGHVESMYHLGNCLQLGRGVEKDESKAVFW
jgi:TPR repeat protein